jgi:hypothetical protein
MLWFNTPLFTFAFGALFIDQFLIYQFAKSKILSKKLFQKMNDHKAPKEDTPQNSKKSKQMLFAAGLLILWLLVYLAIHYKILKN